MKKRRKYTTDFKNKVTLEALRAQAKVGVMDEMFI